MADLREILLRYNHAFALTIDLVPDPLRHETTIGYLLSRLADVFATAPAWRRKRRLAGLISLRAHLRGRCPRALHELIHDWFEPPPGEDEGVLAVVASAPSLLAALEALPAPRRSVIVRHAVHAIEGRARMVVASGDDGSISFHDLEQLLSYCHTVAGSIAEMIAELVLASHPELLGAAAQLRTGAVRVGEALALITFLQNAERTQLSESLRARIVALAYADFDAGVKSWMCLRDAGATRSLLSTLALPILLGRPALAAVGGRRPPTDAARSWPS